ncbi:MAG: hypothetical protein R3F54_10805 [Alphaproteobacteria bacterium]
MARALPGLALGIAFILLLAGCATDDPKEGGLLGGLVGLGSGAYRDRIDRETAALNAEQIRHRQEVDGKTALDGRLDARRAHAAELDQQVVSLRADIDSLETDILALQQDEAVTQDQVDAAEAEVASLLDDIDRIEEEQALQEEARALGADADPDSDPAAFGEPPLERVSELRAYIEKLQNAIDALKASRERHAGAKAETLED